MKHVVVEPVAPPSRWAVARLTAVSLVLALVTLGAGQAPLPPAAQVAEVRKYIKIRWSTLSRSNRDLPAAAKDPKLPTDAGLPLARLRLPAGGSRARGARGKAGSG